MRAEDAQGTSTQSYISPSILVYKDDGRANMVNTKYSRPDSGLGFQVDFLRMFQVVPSSLRRGRSSQRLPPHPQGVGFQFSGVKVQR